VADPAEDEGNNNDGDDAEEEEDADNSNINNEDEAEQDDNIEILYFGPPRRSRKRAYLGRCAIRGSLSPRSPSPSEEHWIRRRWHRTPRTQPIRGSLSPWESDEE
jgi:hypothetical protein